VRSYEIASERGAPKNVSIGTITVQGQKMTAHNILYPPKAKKTALCNEQK
jgi:hypothetical protein